MDVSQEVSRELGKVCKEFGPCIRGIEDRWLDTLQDPENDRGLRLRKRAFDVRSTECPLVIGITTQCSGR